MSLNNLIVEYLETRSDITFTRIYERIHNKETLVKRLSSRYNLETSEVRAIIDDKILELIDKFDASKGSFRSLLNVAAHRECIDYLSKKNTATQHLTETMVADEEGNLTEIYEVIRVAPTTTEDDIVNEIRKRRDQRQLIASLLRKADDAAKQSISAFLNGTSYRDAAKQLGICHKTVAARIRRLSRKYDEELFGSYSDYFTVPTTKSS